MRILHCLAQYPDRTGSGVYCRNLIRSFEQTGFGQQAVIYARNGDQKVPDLKIKAYPVLFDSEELPFPLAGMSDVMPYRSTVYHKMSKDQLDLWKKAFRRQITRAVEEFRPDVIFCHHLWILCSLVLETDLPVIAISHGTDLRQAAQNPDLFRREVRNLERLKGVIALTAGQVPDLIRHSGVGEDKIMIGGGAYDEQVFYPLSEPEERETGHVRFIYAGKIADAKGVFEMVEAFMRLPKTMEYTLDVVGKPVTCSLDLIGKANEEELRRFEELCGHDPRIRLMDAESQLVLAEHMRHSDIFIFPSYYEGLGLIALEALASGLRLVTTDLPALKEFLGKEIWENPHLSVVPMPELCCLDRIKHEAREGHIRRLTEAMKVQAERFAQDAFGDQSPLDFVQAFSWQGLSSRIRGFAENVLVL